MFDKNSLNKDLYKNLENEKTNIDYERVILKDLDRTFPKQSHFKTKYGTGQRSLYRVLCSYSKYNKEIGICSRNGIYSCFIINLYGWRKSFFMMESLMKKYQLEVLYKPQTYASNESVISFQERSFSMENCF